MWVSDVLVIVDFECAGVSCLRAPCLPASTCRVSLCVLCVLCPAESSSSVRDQCLLWGSSQPEQGDIIAALNEAARESGDGKQGGLGALLEKWQKPRHK